METVSVVESRAELNLVIAESLAPFGMIVTPEMIKVHKYGYDYRIGWDTHIISVQGYGVWGFSKGDIPK